MNDGTRDPGTLTEEYLDTLDQDVDEERRRELEETLEKLHDRHERYAEQHGADSGIVQRVDQKIEDVEGDSVNSKGSPST